MKTSTDRSKTTDASSGSKPAAKDDLKTMPLADLEKKLGYSADGLGQAEAAKRLTTYGPNELEEKKPNEILKFLSYFWGPIPWMIEIAVILHAQQQGRYIQFWYDAFRIDLPAARMALPR